MAECKGSKLKAKQDSFIARFKDLTRLTADDFYKVWEHYDSDGNGYIEGKELENFFQELIQCHESPDAVSDTMFKEICTCFMEAYDENEDGKIEMKELAELLQPEENFLLLFRTTELRSSVEFMEAWRKYDTDKSGYIESSELKNFLRDLLEKGRKETDLPGEVVTDDKLEEYTKIMLKLFDRNNDGKLEIKEMSRLLPVKENFLMQFEGSLLPGNHGKRKLTREDFNKVFSHYDKDGNGTIEGDELKGFLIDLLEHEEGEVMDMSTLTSSASALLKLCDVNGDGKIQKEELRMLLCHPEKETNSE